MERNLLHGDVHERIDGVIRKFSIGTDINKMLNFAVGGHGQMSVSRISFDEEFLEKWGKVRMLVYTRVGKHERIWKQVIDQTVIQYEIQSNPNEIFTHGREHGNRKGGPSAGGDEVRATDAEDTHGV